MIEFDSAGGYGRRAGDGTGTYECNITAQSNLDQVLKDIRYGGGTDVSLPFQYVQRHGLENKIDAVVMITDSESWAGGRHTFQVLDEIRKKNPAMKAVEVQLAPGFHKQLRGDAREMLVCGFDASVYQVVSDFIAS